MAIDLVNVGAAVGDGTGDPLRTSWMKVNGMFAELYNRAPGGLAGLLAADASSGNYRVAVVGDISFAGKANGLATLDSNGTLPTAQLPSSVLGASRYEGTWDASTDTPAIPAASSSNQGWYYVVSVAGTTTIDGISSWAVGDQIISDGTKWEKIPNQNAVTSVAGLTGAITATALLGTFAALNVTYQIGTFSDNGTNGTAQVWAKQAATGGPRAGVNVWHTSAGAGLAIQQMEDGTGVVQNSGTANVVKWYDKVGNLLWSLTGGAALANTLVQFFGPVQVPTPTAGDNSQLVATTAYVQNALTALGGTPSGTVVFTILSAAPAGWLMFADQTIGDASSGAAFANASAQAVFTALFNNASDANCPLLTSSGAATTRSAQTSAADAWAAHCRMSMPKTLGRALAVAGSGAGLTARAMAQHVGAETVTLAAGNIPSMEQFVTNVTATTGTFADGTQTNYNQLVTGITVSYGTAGYGGNNPFGIMEPTTFLNAMVKL